MPLLIGLGVITSASADSQSLQNTLDKTVVEQGQQVTQSIAARLQQSYQAEIATMAKQAATRWTEKQQVIARNTLMQAQNTTTTEK